ncbi:MAG TPA: type II toxin-antitoxin system RelE/ParE family toxin [Pyrinomonadaceae bacterium]|jgi:plasmid stabilization system protein ParE|nr:type II toxin-antitoxin system RelE/ParE family toxin [Pyrinomonadaceae bacterium]
MAYQVVWSPTALEDIEAIASYISRDSVSYAGTVVSRVINSTRNLENFPFAGRIVPEFGSKFIREVFAYSYRIIYRIDNETVTVAAVIHARREL